MNRPFRASLFCGTVPRPPVAARPPTWAIGTTLSGSKSTPPRLVPKYLAKVPRDAFNEKPLVYQKTVTGYLFYSVGLNGIDDGGKFLNGEPRGDDVGVRMPGK